MKPLKQISVLLSFALFFVGHYAKNNVSDVREMTIDEQDIVPYNGRSKQNLELSALEPQSKISLQGTGSDNLPPNLFMKHVVGTGSGTSNGDYGPATSAGIFLYGAPWVDHDGTLFIPEGSSGSSRIRQVDAAGIIRSSPLGWASGGPQGFTNLYSIVGDETFLFLSDQKYVWRYVRSTGIVSAIAHAPYSSGGFSGDGGHASSAQLNNPMGLWLTTSNNLYIADYYNYRIRKLTNASSIVLDDMIISTVAGSGNIGVLGDSGPATLAYLFSPQAVYVDTTGRLFIADTNNYRIRVVTGSIITTFAGTGSYYPFNGENIPAISANLYYPCDVKGDSAGNIYIADYYWRIVRMVDASGIIFTLFGNVNSGFSGGISPRLNSISNPTGLWVDTYSAAVYFSHGYYYIHRGFIVSTPTSQPTGQPTKQPNCTTICTTNSSTNSFSNWSTH
jgi:hypothetical protein